MALENYDFSDAVHYHYGKFPPEALDYQKLVGPLTQAAASIARYDALLQSLPNSDLLLSPLRRREAVISSRIEGTVATLDEVLELEAQDNADDEKSNFRSEVLEVLAYNSALYHAQSLIEDNGLPISGRVIREAHQELLAGTRGASKQPGEFKDDQNYIVDKPKKKVLFIPPDPTRFRKLFDTLEAFMNDSTVPPLLQIALAHVEFEALHPFKDGNGRVGRMLVTLMLWTSGIISSPQFYLSDQLEQTRDEYIDKMRAVSAENDWTGWCLFFLDALQKQAEANSKTAKEIRNLYDKMKPAFRATTQSQWATAALDYIFARPIFRTSSFAKDAGIPKQTAHRIANALVKEGLLTVVRPASGRRSALNAFEPLLSLVRA